VLGFLSFVLTAAGHKITTHKQRFGHVNAINRHSYLNIITLRALSGAVYCYRSCLWACLQRAGGPAGGRAVSVTTITRNCVNRSSPN